MLFEPGAMLPCGKGRVRFIVLSPLSVTPFELLIVKEFGPFVEGNSTLVVVWAALPAYSSVDDAPYVGDVPVAVAVPCKESVPIIVAPVIVLDPLFESVRLV